MATDRNLIFLTFPVATAAVHGVDDWPKLRDLIETSPRSVRDMLASSRSAAFIRGLAKANGLPIERAPRIAYAVLLVSLGEIELAQLPSHLSTRLNLANDKAQQVAQEIESDLLDPIKAELEAFWGGQKKQVKRQSKNRDAGAKNVLNLRDNKPPPAPPPMPSA